MRVLQVVTDTDRRGAQVFATDLDAALVRRGHTVGTVALEAGSTTDGLDLPVLGRRRLDPRGLRSLRARMGRADVTVAHGSTTGIACALSGLGPGRPFVYRQISDSRFWAPNRSRRLRVRAVLRRAALVTALSSDAAGVLVDYLALDPTRIRIVPNGVRLEAFPPATTSTRASARAALGLRDDGPTLLFVGALVPEKGADLALAATARLVGTELVVVGDGPERDELERSALRSAPGRVHFLGSRRDPVTAYHAADVVVFPSRGGDSMPAALIEAGACALPSVATDVGSIAEVVVDGTTGLMVDPDDLDALTAAVARLMGDGSLRRRLGEAARERSLALFDIDVVAAAWETVLLEAVERRS